MANRIVAQVELKDKFDFNPETGIFSIKGSVVDASHNVNGYRAIRMEPKSSYKVHRMAFLWMYGELPNGEVDHINLDRADNRMVNLRICTRSQNAMNRKVQSNNKLGVKGVYYRQEQNRYIATARKNRKLVMIGRYMTLQEAKDAYDNYTKLHHGEFHRP